MSNTFRPRVPNFVDRSIFEESYLAEVEFETFDELMSKCQFLQDKAKFESFKCFSVSDDILMLETHNHGFHGLGFLKSMDGLEHLPIFVHPSKQ